MLPITEGDGLAQPCPWLLQRLRIVSHEAGNLRVGAERMDIRQISFGKVTQDEARGYDGEYLIVIWQSVAP